MTDPGRFLIYLFIFFASEGHEPFPFKRERDEKVQMEHTKTQTGDAAQRRVIIHFHFPPLSIFS